MPTLPRRVIVAALLVAVIGGACAPSAAPSDRTPTASGATSPAADLPMAAPAIHPSVDDYPDAVVTIVTPDRELSLVVKHADTRERQLHGLMEVTDLPDTTGMIFTFPSDRESGFWMKGTLIPLDIAYITADGRIAAILRMEPCTPEQERTLGRCPSYPPGTAYRSTLEVGAGWFARHDVSAGDVVSIAL